MLRRELIFLHSASGDGCNDRPLLLATQEDFYRPVALTRFLHSVHTIPGNGNPGQGTERHARTFIRSIRTNRTSAWPRRPSSIGL
jgi:aminoglycoside phosphotransferase (APT) family kinase protein